MTAQFPGADPAIPIAVSGQTLANIATLGHYQLEAREAEEINAIGIWLRAGAAWTPYTPSLVQGGAVAATVNFAEYFALGKLRMVRGLLTATAAGTPGNPITVVFPTSAPDLRPQGTVGVPIPYGTIVYFYSGVGQLVGAAYAASGSPQNIRIMRDAKADALGTASDPLTIASGDAIGFELTFRGV